MKKYHVQVKWVEYAEIEIEAGNTIHARNKAKRLFVDNPGLFNKLDGGGAPVECDVEEVYLLEG